MMRMVFGNVQNAISHLMKRILKEQMKQLTEYEIDRNKLIPIAEAYADRIAGLAPNSSEKAYADWIKLWNVTYHHRMQKLWEKEVKN